MKTSRVLMLAVALMVGVGFVAVAQTAAPAAPMLGQPGSLIEVYGVIDGALRFANNASVGPQNYGEFYLSQGLFNGSRVGFRGTEGLGSGFKAIYDLETGVILPTGQLDQQDQIFGRQAWVGVDSADYGRLTFGRVYGTFSDAIGAGDVFGAGHGNQPYESTSANNNYASNDAVNAFFLQESGLRWDNSIKYEANFSGVTLGGQVSLGDIPTTIGATGFLPENTMYAASIGYNSKNFPVPGRWDIRPKWTRPSGATATMASGQSMLSMRQTQSMSSASTQCLIISSSDSPKTTVKCHPASVTCAQIISSM